MNKKYIDFVPKSSAGDEPEMRSRMRTGGATDVPRVVASQKVRMDGMVHRSSSVRQGAQVVRQSSVTNVNRRAAQPTQTAQEITRSNRSMKIGEIESIPTGSNIARDTTEPSADIEAVKSRKIPKITLGMRRKDSGNVAGKSEKRDTDKIMGQAVNDAHDLDKKLKIPKTPFVNTEKVTKRPLSKNVYQKKIESPKEIPQGPVTIIAKPEKDSKMSLVVTIVITIILGAAAGTVAFLLLPK